MGSTKLKNIAEPVHVYSLEVGKTPLARIKPAVAKQRSIFVPLAAGIVALIAIAGSAWYFLGANRPATVISNAPAARADAAHLSIVVLPFRNLSGDPSQDYFADGITENLTTDLSRIRNSFVIARNTAFTFKGKNIDTKEISKDRACAISSKARCSATRTGCASTLNLLMARPARISGPIGSRKASPISSSFKIR